MLILNYRHFLVCSVVCSTQTFFWRLQRNHAKAKGLFQEQVQLHTLTFQLHYVFDMYLQSYEQLDSKNVKCYSPLQRLVPWQRHCEIEFHTDSLMIVHVCNITKFTSQVKEVKAAFVGERGGWNPMMKQILQVLPWLAAATDVLRRPHFHAKKALPTGRRQGFIWNSRKFGQCLMAVFQSNRD